MKFAIEIDASVVVFVDWEYFVCYSIGSCGDSSSGSGSRSDSFDHIICQIWFVVDIANTVASSNTWIDGRLVASTDNNLQKQQNYREET